jgi:hypothetical protein
MAEHQNEGHSSHRLLGLALKVKLAKRDTTTRITGGNKKMATQNAATLGRSRTGLMHYGALAALISSLFCGVQTVFAANPPSITATYTVTAISATCDLAMDTPVQITLPAVNVANFVGSSIAAGIGAPIRLRLEKCSGMGGQMVPKISVYGDRDQVATDPNLYRGSASVATNVGFVLLEGANESGKLMDAGTIDTPVKIQVPGTDGSTVPDGKTIDFYVQYSRGVFPVNSVTTGSLATTIHFDFLYE